MSAPSTSALTTTAVKEPSSLSTTLAVAAEKTGTACA